MCTNEELEAVLTSNSEGTSEASRAESVTTTVDSNVITTSNAALDSTTLVNEFATILEVETTANVDSIESWTNTDTTLATTFVSVSTNTNLMSTTEMVSDTSNLGFGSNIVKRSTQELNHEEESLRSAGAILKYGIFS